MFTLSRRQMAIMAIWWSFTPENYMKEITYDFLTTIFPFRIRRSTILLSCTFLVFSTRTDLGISGPPESEGDDFAPLSRNLRVYYYSHRKGHLRKVVELNEPHLHVYALLRLLE